MKVFKLFIIIFMLLMISGCNNQYGNSDFDNTIKYIEIGRIPNKTTFEAGEEIDLTGLIVKKVFESGNSEVIDDYVLEYPEIKIGSNTILVKYLDFETSFRIYVNDYKRTSLLEYVISDEVTLRNINFNDYNLMFADVKYGIRRDKDMMIVYDENKFIDTNVYGYEISVDEFGYVVDIGTNVELSKNGFVVSSHGVRNLELKQVAIGDVCLYVDGMIFIYQESLVDERNKVYLKFIDVLNNVNLIDDVLTYNSFVERLNEIIPLINLLDVNDEENIETLYDYLCELEDEFKLDIYEHTHNYNYLDLDYKMLSTVIEKEEKYTQFVSYDEKLYYGGFRKQDTIVYYDKDNYRERNAFGYEIAVDKNNIIIDMKVLVDLPVDGYILSGHGTGADFIKDNLTIGNKVIITDTNIFFEKDIAANFYNELITKRNNVVELLNKHIEEEIPHDYEYINELIKYIDKKLRLVDKEFNDCYQLVKTVKEYRSIEEVISVLYAQLIDYKVLETRGMWYYPFSYPNNYDDTSLDGVRKTLDMFKEMGFNEIVLLTFSGKYSIYKSDYFHFYEPLNNYYYGEYENDYLKCFITEAHKRGISVNAFTQTFRCYEEGSIVFDESHYQVDYNGEFSRGQIYYYDICSDYVQSNLIGWYEELVTLYDFDKVEYDIIRYSVSNLSKYSNIDVIPESVAISDPGYTTYSMEKFKKLYGYDGDLRDLIRTSLDVRTKWLEFKENELINFITKATSSMKAIKSDLVISAAVFNDYENAKNNYLQDYKRWLELGIVDIIEPMVYSDDYLFVQDKVAYFNEHFSNYEVRIGLSYGLSLNELIMQMELSSNNGCILFHTRDYLTAECLKVLKNSFHFNYVSDISSNEEQVSAVIDDLIDKICNYYQVRNNIEYHSLIKALNELNIDEALGILSTIEDVKMANYLKNIINDLK